MDLFYNFKSISCDQKERKRTKLVQLMAQRKTLARRKKITKQTTHNIYRRLNVKNKIEILKANSSHVVFLAIPQCTKICTVDFCRHDCATSFVHRQCMACGVVETQLAKRHKSARFARRPDDSLAECGAAENMKKEEDEILLPVGICDHVKNPDETCLKACTTAISCMAIYINGYSGS
jgi:hypothetical protein